LNAAKENLEAFYEEKLDRVIIRARARWHELGEKSSKYFLNLEKTNHVKKRVRKLKISGVITTDPFSISAEQKHFYQELYKNRNNNKTDGTHTLASFLYFSIALKVFFSLSDRYKIFTSNWRWIEICENVVLSKIDITMTTINKQTGN